MHKLIALLISLLLANPTFAEQFKSTGTTDVYFSPNVGATHSVVFRLPPDSKGLL